MGARAFVSSVAISRLGILCILLLCVTTALPAAPRTPAPITATTAPIIWTATFYHAGLDQTGTLLATANTCVMSLHGSTPPTLTLNLKLDRPIGSGRRLQVYAGWPQNALGQVTGVRNCSSGPVRTSVNENKLGPTILWIVSGCTDVCVQASIRTFVITISRAAETFYVIKVVTPTPDSWLGARTCLMPAFIAEGLGGFTPLRGAIDQPGCTITAGGEGFRDIVGRDVVIQAGDRIAIDFHQRALISCGQNVAALTDWDYRLSATLGRPAPDITPAIHEDVSVELLLEHDPDPAKRARFAKALAEIREMQQPGARP